MPLVGCGDLGMPRAEAKAWVNNEGPDWRGRDPGARDFLLSLSVVSLAVGASPRYRSSGGGGAVRAVSTGVVVVVVVLVVLAVASSP